MARVAAALRHLQERCLSENGWPLTIVLLHHAPKPREAGGNSAETMARGSSDLYNAVDVAIYLRKGREPGHIVVEHAKARWGELLPPFLARIESTDDSVRVSYVGAADELQGEVDRARETIITILREGGTTLRKELIDRLGTVGVKSRTAERALEQMVAETLVARTKLGRQVQYALTESGQL